MQRNMQKSIQGMQKSGNDREPQNPNGSSIIDKESPRVATQKLPLLVQLMPHQKAMVYSMLMIEEKLKHGRAAGNIVGEMYAMMSDKPGAGKTFAVLAFIYFADKVASTGATSTRATSTRATSTGTKPAKSVNLIVVPYNICTQWKDSMVRIFGPLVKYKVLTEYADIMRLYTSPEELMGYDILLTTSLYFSNIASTLNSLNLRVKRVFFDEADTIKSLLTVPLGSEGPGRAGCTTWFISASMESLFGKSEKVSIGNYNMSQTHLRNHDVKCNPEFINENIILDAPLVHKYEVKNVYYKLLKEVVKPQFHANIDAMDYRCLRSEFMRGTRTGTGSGPDSYLHPNIDSEYQACLYVFLDNIEKEKHGIHQIELLKTDYDIMLKKEFWDAAKEIKRNIDITEVMVQEAQRIISNIRFFSSKYDISAAFEEKAAPSESKFEKLCDVIFNTIIAKNPRAQCILFTNFDYIYTLLMPVLERRGVRYKYLDGGNIATMDAIIGAYKRQEFNLLLADSSMYSCGMNLENTSDIIFVHPMEALREKQVIGRAYRYGREGTLNLWYLDYHGTHGAPLNYRKHK